MYVENPIYFWFDKSGTEVLITLYKKFRKYNSEITQVSYEIGCIIQHSKVKSMRRFFGSCFLF